MLKCHNLKAEGGWEKARENQEGSRCWDSKGENMEGEYGHLTGKLKRHRRGDARGIAAGDSRSLGLNMVPLYDRCTSLSSWNPSLYNDCIQKKSEIWKTPPRYEETTESSLEQRRGCLQLDREPQGCCFHDSPVTPHEVGILGMLLTSFTDAPASDTQVL